MVTRSMVLPDLRTLPDYATLTTALSTLQRDPATFLRPVEGEEGGSILDAAAITWLTRLVAHPLTHLDDNDNDNDDDDGKHADAIWTLASAALSQACGRAAAPAMTRTFHVGPPYDRGQCVLRIHEPTLLHDHVGLKTWAASFLTARLLASHLYPTTTMHGKKGLELGSGTGVLGLAMAHVLGCRMTLTDLPDLMDNLTRNVVGNAPHPAARVTALDWRDPESSTLAGEQGTFDVVVASDFIYTHTQPALIVDMCDRFVEPTRGHVLMAYPLRQGNDDIVADFRARMAQHAWCVTRTGKASGYDDWGGNSEVVVCWHMYHRRSPSSSPPPPSSQ